MEPLMEREGQHSVLAGESARASVCMQAASRRRPQSSLLPERGRSSQSLLTPPRGSTAMQDRQHL